MAKGNVAPYWYRVLRRAWADTYHFFALDRRKLLWGPPVFAIGSLVHLGREGKDAVLSELTVTLSYGVFAVGLAAIFLYVWNLLTAPARMEREAAREAGEQRNRLLVDSQDLERQLQAERAELQDEIDHLRAELAQRDEVLAELAHEAAQVLKLRLVQRNLFARWSVEPNIASRPALYDVVDDEQNNALKELVSSIEIGLSNTGDRRIQSIEVMWDFRCGDVDDIIKRSGLFSPFIVHRLTKSGLLVLYTEHRRGHEMTTSTCRVEHATNGAVTVDFLKPAEQPGIGGQLAVPGPPAVQNAIVLYTLCEAYRQAQVPASSDERAAARRRIGSAPLSDKQLDHIARSHREFTSPPIVITATERGRKNIQAKAELVIDVLCRMKPRSNVADERLFFDHSYVGVYLSVGPHSA